MKPVITLVGLRSSKPKITLTTFRGLLRNALLTSKSVQSSSPKSMVFNQSNSSSSRNDQSSSEAQNDSVKTPLLNRWTWLERIRIELRCGLLLSEFTLVCELCGLCCSCVWRWIRWTGLESVWWRIPHSLVLLHWIPVYWTWRVLIVKRRRWVRVIPKQSSWRPICRLIETVIRRNVVIHQDRILDRSSVSTIYRNESKLNKRTYHWELANHRFCSYEQ